MKIYFKLGLVALVLALMALALSLLTAPPARAAGPWYVGPGGNDGGACTSQATRCATINGALNKPGFVASDTIRVAIGTYTGTGNEVVLLDKNATLSGGWDNTFTTQNGTSTVDGQGARIGINVNSGVTTNVERFVVQNGWTGFGGGIRNNGTLTLNNSTVSDNEVSLGTARGGGIGNVGTMIVNSTTISGNTSTFKGGGIYNLGSLTLTNSIMSGNTVDGLGGGIYNDGGTMTLNNSAVNGNMGGGGGIYNDGGTMTLNDSTASSNKNPSGGGGGIINSGTMTLNNTMVNGNLADSGGIGGGIINRGTMILNNSITMGNMAASDAGGIYNSFPGNLTLNNSSVISNTTGVNQWRGGGILIENGTVTLNNSTVSGNSATSSGGGIFIGGGVDTLILNSSTVSNNMAKQRGGGIDAALFGTVTLQNTILAGNTTPDLGFSPDCYGNIGTAGYNLIGDTSGCTFTPNTGDWINVNVKLGPLEGSPGYHPLLFGSSAIDTGNPAGCTDHLGNPLTTDQRGVPRMRRCDIGAYEYDGPFFQTFLPIILRN